MNSQTRTSKNTIENHFAYAEQLATAHNARLTPIRKHIYRCLLEAEAPLGAYELLDMLDGIGASKPPTVYRGLDWLIDIGLAKKIESTSKYIAKTASDEMQQLALLLCEKCGHAEPFDAGSIIQSLGAEAESKGFQSHQTVIEIIGRCAEHRS
jgi:Fur family zinc uptake transcriptional regulator